jgi:hypothetical protein
MKTDDLIRALAADHAARGASLERALAGAVALGFAIAATLFVLFLGPRPDIATELGDPRLAFKFAITLLLAASSVMVGLRLARPTDGTRAWSLALAAVPVILLAAVLIELAVMPRASWLGELVGENSMLCLTSIPLLAAPILVATLLILRRGVSLRPGLTGAAAGLFAGALGAALYAAHCPDDSPLFVAVWYGLAIAAVAIVGALAGRIMLRW